MRIIKCYVYPKLLYGAEPWAISKNLEKRTEAWKYRRIMHVSWTRRKNNDVLHQLGLRRELINDMQKRKTAYLGNTELCVMSYELCRADSENG
jgi:hypothetical protein